jgi:hypothetical protein
MKHWLLCFRTKSNWEQLPEVSAADSQNSNDYSQNTELSVEEEITDPQNLHNMDQDPLEIPSIIEEGSDEEVRPPSVPPPQLLGPVKTPKREANKVVAEMQQINNTVKTIFDNVNKRKADPTKEELFGQQVTNYLKECKNIAKKKKIMSTVFSMMMEDDEYE